MTEFRDEWRFGLTRRGVAAVVLVGALALVIGVWVGVWSVPARALEVPMQASEYGRGMDLFYRPVPTYLPIMSVFVVGAGVWQAWRVTHPPEDGDDD